MRYLLITFFLTLTFSLQANVYQCIDKLTDEGAQDTLSLTINLDELEEIFTKDYQTSVQQGQWIVRAFLEYVGCYGMPSKGKYKSDVSFTYLPHGLLSNSKCFFLNQETQSGLACHIEANLGKFLVYWDDFNAVHVIYSRWD